MTKMRIALLIGRHVFLCLAAFCLRPGFAAEPALPLQTPRVEVRLDSGWRFLLDDAAGAEVPGFEDSAWAPVALPHTWNNFDGEDGGNNYHRGTGWYRTHFTADDRFAGRHCFLKFDGASLVAEVWINGKFLGRHAGGFAAFVFDITPFVQNGADNLIAVKVSNASNPDVPPLSADFTFFGGLYRSVHLLLTDPVQISPLDFGSCGVYLKTTGVTSHSAAVQVTTLVSNSLAARQAVLLRTTLFDADTNVVARLTNAVNLPPSALATVVANTTLANPQLWNGLAGPYLYRVRVELLNGSRLLDAVEQPLGLRSLAVDPDKGFFLNGRPYDLHGVALHQDWLDCGWAINEAQRQTNFLLLKEIGATAVRLSHYQNSDRIYQLADASGVALWTEIPLIDSITESPAFYACAKQQLTELIRQNFNHPSIICWGIFNEITLKKGPPVTNLVSQLAALAAAEDPTRPSTCAVAGKAGQSCNWFSKLTSFNKYSGWYSASVSDFGPWIDQAHADHPTNCIGISEYGAGASIGQHSEDPVAQPQPKGKFHPEEYQNLFHEAYWQALQQRPYLWCKFVWNLADFAIDNRSEGDTAGRNDKGLVTYDRRVRKDAFFWYKANWTTNPMVYITGHTFTNRLTNSITARVYANCGAVELYLNGVSQGVRTSTNCLYTWPVVLSPGTNTVRATAKTEGIIAEDSLTWTAPAGP